MAKAKKQADSTAVADNPAESSLSTPPTTSIVDDGRGRDEGRGRDRREDDEGREHEGLRHEDGRGRDRIAMRAYELYLARGGADGGDFDDWLAAERELARGPAAEKRNLDE